MRDRAGAQFSGSFLQALMVTKYLHPVHESMHALDKELL